MYTLAVACRVQTLHMQLPATVKGRLSPHVSLAHGANGSSSKERHWQLITTRTFHCSKEMLQQWGAARSSLHYIFPARGFSCYLRLQLWQEKAQAAGRQRAVETIYPGSSSACSNTLLSRISLSTLLFISMLAGSAVAVFYMPL